MRNGRWATAPSTTVDGLPLVATWGGGSYSPDAVARVGRLLLHRGTWEGRELLDPAVVDAALKPSGMPGHSGLGWWVNTGSDGTRLWKSAPEDAFGGAGAGHQFLLVVPSLDLIVVRNGERLDPKLPFDEGLDRYVVAPVIRAISTPRKAPYPPSPVIRAIRWAPKESIVRKARGSDTWPLTWADDDALYTAFGDGQGFDPQVPEKLSLGFARVVGPPEDFAGINIRSATGERKGTAPRARRRAGCSGRRRPVPVGQERRQLPAGLVVRPCEDVDLVRLEVRDELRLPDVPELRQGLRRGQGRLRLYLLPGWRQRLPGRRPHGPGEGAEERITDRGGLRVLQGPDGRACRLDRGHRRTRGGLPSSGRCYRSAISYDAGLKRYLWCQTLPGGDARFRGGFGIYDAPEPWGPWTTAYFTEEWDVGPGETSSFPDQVDERRREDAPPGLLGRRLFLRPQGGADRGRIGRKGAAASSQHPAFPREAQPPVPIPGFWPVTEWPPPSCPETWR